MKVIFVLITSLVMMSFSICSSFAQDEFVQHHKAGFHAGSTTGIGFSYKYQPKKLGIQVVGAPFFFSGGDSFLSLGISGLYRLQESRKIDIFTYLGNNMIFAFQEMRYNLGVGAGIDLHIWPSVLDLNIQAGYGIYAINTDPMSLVAGEIGLHYLIKTPVKKKVGGL